MKISLLAILFTAASTFVAYSSAAQHLREVKASLPTGTASLRDALKQLEKQTDIRFSYRTGDISGFNSLAVDGNGTNVADILDNLLANTGLRYEQVGNAVILKKAPVAPVPTTVAPVAVQPGLAGQVVDENGLPLAGVTVRIKGASAVTTTDNDGRFILTAPGAGAILVVSYIGYQTREVNGAQLTGANSTVALQPDFGKLDEVTVIAYGTTSKRVSTGSSAGISATEIAQAPINNPLEALQGRIAGLEVNATNGLPGSAFTVRLRGLNSTRSGGNDPLYIVDGVPYFSQPLNQFTGDNGQQSPLAGINPADIERIDILKDADATAIYGSRAANGVVMITTKKGTAGRPQVNFHAYSGAGKVTNLLEVLNTAEYLELRREAFRNSNIEPTEENAPDLLTWSQTEDQNWQKRLIGGTAKLTEANFSVSGGSEQTRFMISGTFRNEGTVQPGDNGYQKGSGLLSLDHRSSDNRFGITATANYVADFNDAMATDISQYYNLAPNMPIYDDAGAYYWYGNDQNPIAFLERRHETRNNALLTSATVRYSPLQGLTLSTAVGYNRTTLNQLQLYPRISFNPTSSATSMAYFGNGENSSYSIEPQATYTYTHGKGKLDVLAGATWQENVRDGQFLQGEDFTSDAQLHNIAAAVTIRPRSFNYSKYRYQAGFARVTYNWANTYIVNASFRRDGSSRFGPDRRVGNFGAVGAAWVFSEENLLKEGLPFLSFGKLRGSFGSTGNDQIGDYGFLDSWSYTTYPYGGISGLYPTRVANPEYSWERNRKLEGGLELGFLNNRLSLNVNYYFNRSDNQLINFTLSPQTGFPGYTANLPAIVHNKGWEFEATSVNVRNDAFEWSTSANLTLSRNKLVEYPGLEGSSQESNFAIGHPLGSVYGFKFTGVDPATGVAQFEDLDGDGQVTNQQGDMYVIGNRLPDFFGGVANTLTYRKLSLNFLLQFVKQQGEALNYGYMASSALGLRANFDRSIVDRWRQPGEQTDIPRSAAGSGDIGYTTYNTFYRHSDALWVDASFIRLKNVTLAYDFTSLLPQLKTQRISLYAQGQNLFTITSYDGFDPETRGRVVPPMKYYTAGIRFTY